MNETVTLELPSELVRKARALAAATNRRLEDAVVDWIGRAVAEPPVESLPDAELLALCDATLKESDQDELSTFLDCLREGSLSEPERGRLEQLMTSYRRGMVLKARACERLWLGGSVQTSTNMPREYLPLDVVRRVREIARHRCGYCAEPTASGAGAASGIAQASHIPRPSVRSGADHVGSWSDRWSGLGN